MRLAALALAAALAGCSGVSERPPVRYEPAAFSDLPGWQDADLRPALAAFRRSCTAAKSPGAHRPAPLPLDAAALRRGLRAACEASQRADAAGADSPRHFFERHFTPYRVLGPDGHEGLFTGYYEPELRASKRKHGEYAVPIHGLPRGEKPGTMLATRAAIENGTAADGWPVLYWAADPVDVFTLHIQGSGRLALGEGGHARVAYAGNNGHGYVAIGRLMRERGLLAADDTTMPTIQAWLRANPEAGRALMQENPRYIFFRTVPDADGVKGQFGSVLTPMASLAVDTAFIPLGAPLWLVTNRPAAKEAPLRLLVVAQDTGAAIKGPVRGDIFWGSGEKRSPRPDAWRNVGTTFCSSRGDRSENHREAGRRGEIESGTRRRGRRGERNEATLRAMAREPLFFSASSASPRAEQLSLPASTPPCSSCSFTTRQRVRP